MDHDHIVTIESMKDVTSENSKSTKNKSNPKKKSVNSKGVRICIIPEECIYKLDVNLFLFV